MVLRAHKEKQVLKDFKDLKGFKETLVRLDPVDLKGPKVPKEIQGFKEKEDFKAFKESAEQLDPKEIEVLKVFKEIVDLKEKEEYKALKESKDLKELQVKIQTQKMWPLQLRPILILQDKWSKI